ncbi:MAG: hypothetical protein ACXVPD_14380, partial [Bacteroidia bacterium]
LLKDDVLSPKFFLAAFLIKCTGLLAFYIVYEKLYGGIRNFDTWHFYHDSKLIHDIGSWNVSEFMKVMLGTYSDSPDADVFTKFISHAEVWDKDPGELLYNDNRLVIRLHVLIQFVSLGQYWVHALFSCFFSFIGIVLIYKTFKFLFHEKEISFFLIWVLFPGLWFWSGNLLKEAPAVLLMGTLLYSSKQILVEKKYSVTILIAFVSSVTLCFFLKHYVMLPLLFFTLLFFWIRGSGIRRKITAYLLSVLLLIIAGDMAFRLMFNKTPAEVIAYRQHTFMDASRGGIFLLDNTKFVRLKYDLNSVVIDSSRTPATVQIKSEVPFMYWEHSHQQDTLYAVNTDTAARYEFKYYIIPAKSTLEGPVLTGSYGSLLKSVPFALYCTMLKPFFYDCRNALDVMTSFENGLILLCTFICIIGLTRVQASREWAVYFVSVALVIFIITGISSPNLGAIERYRALVAPFLLMAALCVVNVKKAEQSAVFCYFKR